MTELTFPLFERAERAGVLAGASAAIVAPTATGKSHIGRDAIRRAFERRDPGPHAYLVPFRALAVEVHDALQDQISSADARILLSTGDHRDPVHPDRCDVIVATYESFAGLMRTESFRPGVVVADEVHLLADQTRGATVEGLLARIVGSGRCGSVIALSAVVENSHELADWLGVQLIEGSAEDRPVVLTLDFDVVDDLDAASARHVECCNEGEQALVFCSSRRGAERLARELSQRLDGCLDDAERGELARIVQEIRTDDPDLSEPVLDLIPYGVACHHAGLPKSVRRQIEVAYRQRLIRLITCTPTLAAGVNLPAGVVVVRDIFRSEVVRGMRRTLPLPSGEVLNMLGRAARPHLVAEGRGVALAKREVAERGAIDELRSAIAARRGGVVRSRLPSSFDGLMRFVLAVIAERGAECTRQHVAAAYEGTLAYHQGPEEIRFDRPFEEDMMEDVPEYGRVLKQRANEPHKPIFIASHRLSSEGVHATVHSSTHIYEVTIGVNRLACTCEYASRWGRNKICRHEALAIHDMLFDEQIGQEARNRAIYNCAHLFGRTLDVGTKLDRALAILTDWRLIERVPGGWRATPLGFVAAGSWFDLLLVHQVTERVSKLDRDAVDYREIARWSVEDYFEEDEQEAWLQAIEQWLGEVSLKDIPIPGQRRSADFERELEDRLAHVCRLYESAATALGRKSVAEAARTAAGALRYGVSPDLIPLMALGFPRLRRARCRHLHERGIRDIDDLALADATTIADPRRAPEKLAREWIERAQEIVDMRKGSDGEQAEDRHLDEVVSRFRIDPAAFVTSAPLPAHGSTDDATVPMAHDDA